ncbi:MAG: hypothetical protein AAF557_12275 [Pseudomonadota bacterium]
MTSSRDDKTIALSTKVEEDFISPLTVIRGALEILNDYPDLPEQERTDFIQRALAECDRLKAGIDHLATTVYAADRRQDFPTVEARYAERISVLDGHGIIDIDFSNFQFQSSEIVNAFYDALDAVVIPRNQKWYFLVNHHNCQIWPEAWVAYAHRSKKISMNFAHAVIRFAEGEGESISTEPGVLPSREAALANLQEIKGTSR